MLHRTTRSVPALALVAMSVCAPDASACYWDSDTLSMEQRRFPGVMELLQNRVLRRSKAVYAWRVKTLPKRIKAEPKNLRLLDELAVAHDKLGQHDEAIAIQNEALSRAPKRYESLANLGTFHLHAGHLAKGIAHIEQAVAVNPDAHFGREVVQLELARYLLAQLPKDKKHAHKALPALPVAHDAYSAESAGADDLVNKLLDDEKATMAATIEPKPPWLDTLPRAIGFAAWLKKHKPKLLEGGKAVQGLSGMLYFGNPRSPYLLEALGDVLRYDDKPKSGSTRLAAMAYLKASLQVKDNYARLGYVAKAGRALAGLRGMSLNKAVLQLAGGMKRGVKVQATIAKDEARWVSKGENPDVRFARAWYKAGGKELERLVGFAVANCEQITWGNLRKRTQVPRKQMLSLVPRDQWHGLSLAAMIDRHGAPICRFRDQWLWPLGSARRGVWLKISGKAGSSVVRLLEPPK